MDQSVESLFMRVCMELWAWDLPLSCKLFKETVQTYIDNLKSHIGEDARQREKELGIIDETGMSAEESDQQLQDEINAYKNLLEYLEDDNNWTW